MEFTAVIKKGEKQYVALCPEVDVVSQGFTKDEALSNLKEAVELYVEEMGLPEEFADQNTTITTFTVKESAKIA